MEILNENQGIQFNEDYYFEKNDILNLIRLQKQLLIEENIVCDLNECANIWQRHSNDLSASWLFFPENDQSILNQIKTSSYFTNFREYSEE
ncbi:hypothetical protein [Flavobacterium denitrificans]|uniref:hypothetical protein n=1 Tax=Flavobacterium denitrificans TaxID=281361 RepID=UPI0003F5BD83|nr:hypothetical protein [Flavobacterium denitrificans]